MVNVCSATVLSKNPVITFGDALVNAKSMKKVLVLYLIYKKYNICSRGSVMQHF